MIRYVSTRGGGESRSFEDVLLSGLAPDGGLYVPESWPLLDLQSLKGKSYIDVAEAVMAPFVEGCIAKADFRTILEETYNPSVFRHEDVVPLHPLYPGLQVLELFHGPTIAFKDVALQLLGRLFDHVLKKRGERVTIVGATSGDTGSAAIEGCRHSAQADIFILYPHGRVSDVQRRQMTTVHAPNVRAIALEGNFDDCQAMVKAMFADRPFREALNLSAVNSINWARIMAQIVYYVTAALALGAPEKDVSFVVPTGNFGNVYAAYCARRMGLPIKTLAIATNRNDILARFFETGEMRCGAVHASLSPSMDIQVSSNFERYLFDLLDRDAQKLAQIMDDFRRTGAFSLPADLTARAQNEFKAFRAGDAETLDIIKKVHAETGYILDPHSAVGTKAAMEMTRGNSGEIVSLACAHPAKFPDAVERATGLRPALPDHLKGLLERKERFSVLPNAIEKVQGFIKEKLRNP